MKKAVLAVLMIIFLASASAALAAGERGDIVLEDEKWLVTLHNGDGLRGVASFESKDGGVTPWLFNAFSVKYGEEVPPEKLHVWFESAVLEDGVVTMVTTQGDTVRYHIESKQAAGAKAYNNELKVLEEEKYQERAALFAQGYGRPLAKAATLAFALLVAAAAAVLFWMEKKGLTARGLK